jgi:hypothetical protein
VAKLARAGATNVIEYRAYFIGSDGDIERRIDFLCDSDTRAKEQAEQLVDGHDVELWQLSRRICEFKARE